MYKSLLPLTDPRDAEAQRMLNIPYSIIMVIESFLLLGLTVEYRSRPWVWLTVIRRPSEVCDTPGELSWQCLRRSAVPKIWLVPT